ncbi:MAG: hypothetical protein ACJASM_002048 [Salibacteraceae bacterium]|jgi:hypothetical protein
MPEMKRYAVTADFYVYAFTDEDGIKTAEEFAKKYKKESDNDFSIVSVHDASETFSKPIKIK